MKSITKRKPEKIVIVLCPSCGRKHRPDSTFGAFCCASCLQLAIRPLIVMLTEALPKR
jgi:NAD-dependent SIR2 family protein deacetylase